MFGSMAAARAPGFLLDGEPDTLMILYLAVERLVVVLAPWALGALPPGSA